MRLKRIIAVVLILVTFWSIMITVTQAATTTIDFLVPWTTADPLGKAIAELVELFNASQDDITVELQLVAAKNAAERLEALNVRLLSGQIPALSMVDTPWLVQFKDVLVPLDEARGRLDIGLTPGDFFPGIRDTITLDGKIRGYPLSLNTIIQFYNRDHYAEAGLPDRAADTWDELRLFAKKLTVDTSGDGSPDRYGLWQIPPGGWGSWVWKAFLWQNGGEILSEDLTEARFNSPAAVEAVEFWLDAMVNEQFASPFGDWRWDMSKKNVSTHFQNLPFTMTLRNNGINYGAGMQPKKVTRAAIIGGWCVGALAGSGKEREALEFIKFVSEPENHTRLMMELSYVPVRRSLLEYEKYANFVEHDEVTRVAVQQMEFAHRIPHTRYYNDILEIIGDSLKKAFSQEMPPKQALDDGVRRANTLLAEERK